MTIEAGEAIPVYQQVRQRLGINQESAPSRSMPTGRPMASLGTIPTTWNDVAATKPAL